MDPNRPKYGLQPKLENIILDLASYKIQLHFTSRRDSLIVHFDKPARRFYFSLIALIVTEMKIQEQPEFIYIRKHEKTLKNLDDSLAGKNKSASVKGMWDKIRKAWRYTLPDLETGSLFKVMNRDTISPYQKGGKYRYDCSEDECDIWANLFGYDENNSWRLKFAIDSTSLTLDDISVRYGDQLDKAAWEDFIKNLTTQSSRKPQQTLQGVVTRKQWPFPQHLQKMAIFLVVISVFITAVLMVWKPDKQAILPAGETTISDKLSIAVLAFDNMSDDQSQEYFCDGFTDDLITDLSKIPDLFVISRNSSFTYKGKSVKVQKIAQELGVKYILEGSIRKVEKQVRINAQLVDGATGHHLWAGKFDRNVGDIFTLQDMISKEILTALNVKLTLGEQTRIFAKNTDSLEAYLLFLQAIHQLRKTNQEGTRLARKLCEQAISLDPNFADPYRALAWGHVWDMWFGWSQSPDESFKKAEELVEKSLTLDDTNPGTVALLGHLYLMKRQHEKAIAKGEKSIALDPNSANNYMLLAGTLRFSGRAAEGIPLLKKAIRLEPHTPANFYYQLGMAYNFTGQYDDAIAVLKDALKRTPDHLLSLIGLTIAYSLADNMKEARATATELLKVNPKLSVANLERKAPYKNKTDLALSIGALRKAGLR